MKIPRTQSGVTLLELMIGLAVVAILGSLAAPSFREMLLSSQITTATNNFITAMAFARSEAVKRALIIRVDAIGGNWDNGWQVINDNDNSIIRTFDAPANTVDVAGVPAVASLRFDGRGLLLGEAAGVVMSVCHSGMRGRQISLSATGRPQLDREYVCP
ncbi:MAG TPA: GspH/FimT family pseudopilin [Gammaproteobacteria bacterium]|nr:GspH/FimT family pseudopilin [Gammaproteobacteria bacterium]